MKRQKAKCHVYCQPCEWFGVCPHSFKEYDDLMKRRKAVIESMKKNRRIKTMRMKNLDDFCIDCPDYGKDTDRCKSCQKVPAKPKKDYWANICEINKQQENKGINKYGYTLENNPLKGVPVWIRYMEEELIDGLKYAEKILDEYEKYRWHILNDNPKDLPTWSHDVLICMETTRGGKGYFVVFYDSETRKFIFKRDIDHQIDIKSWPGRIAWKEIEEL